MDSTIPAELHELKVRIDTWRANRRHIREKLPADLRSAVEEMGRRYPHSLIRRILKFNPWRLKTTATSKKPSRAKVLKASQTAFFRLPAEAALPELELSSPQKTTDCRIQLERPDGSRLTLTLPALDHPAVNRLCIDFLQGERR